MGYSARADAFEKLHEIEKNACTGKSTNTIVIKGREIGFFEIGEEQADGAIVGNVIEFVKTPSTEGRGSGVPAGAFKISPDGVVERFPLLPKHLW